VAAWPTRRTWSDDLAELNGTPVLGGAYEREPTGRGAARRVACTLYVMEVLAIRSLPRSRASRPSKSQALALAAISAGFLMITLDATIVNVALGAIGLAVASYALLRRKSKTTDDVERERRAWLSTVGRITDGTVIDVQEIAVDTNRPATMLIYQYDVAGVSYEASQDVTYLRQWINLHSCRLGLPTSVRYDARNPGNSMVIAEGWMGLRQ